MSRFGRSRLSESDCSDLVTSPVPSDFAANSPSRRISTSEVRWGIRSPNFERSGSSESLDDRGSVCSNFSRPDGEFIPTRTTVVSVKPAANAMQFVKSGPAKLVLTAQEQLKKAEEIKKVKMVVKEDDEDWQKNLEGWKMSRRKRQEPVIQRVCEVKKFEQEEEMRLFEARGRKNRTFSEMLGRSNGRKQSLGLYPDDDQDGSFNFSQSVDEPYTPSSEPEKPSFPNTQTVEEPRVQIGDCDSVVNGEIVQSVKPSSVNASVVNDSKSESSDFSPAKKDLRNDDFGLERRERLASPKKESHPSHNSHSTSRVYQSSVRIEKRYTEFNGSREGSAEPVAHKESVVQQRYLSQLEGNAREKFIPEKKTSEEITANVKMRRSLFERQSSGEVVTSNSDARRKSGEISEGLRSKLQALTTAENSILGEEAKFLNQRRKSLEMSESLKSKLQALAAEETISSSRVTPEKDETFREKLKNFQTSEKPAEYKKAEPKFPENIDAAYSVRSKLANFEQKPEPEKIVKPPPGRLASELIRPKTASVERENVRIPEAVRNGSLETKKPEVNQNVEPEVRSVESWPKPEMRTVVPSSVEKVESWVESVEQRSRIPVPTVRPAVKVASETPPTKSSLTSTEERESRSSSSASRREELVNQKPWEPEAVLLAPSAKLGPPKSKPPPPPPETESSDEDDVAANLGNQGKVEASPLRSLDDSPQSLESAAFVNMEADSPVALESYKQSPTSRGSTSDVRRRLDEVPSPRYIVSPLDVESDELTRKEMEIIESLEKEEEARLKRLVKKSQGFDPSSLDASIASDDQESASSLNESLSSNERLGYMATESSYTHLGHTRTGSDPFRVVPRPSVAPSEPNRTIQGESKVSGLNKQTVQETRATGQNPKEAPRRLLPKAPSVDYLDHEIAGLKPIRKEEAKRDVSKHWLVQEAEQRLLESQIRRSNDSLPTNDYPPSTLQHQMSSQMFPRSSSMGSITRPPGGPENVLSQSVSGNIPGPAFRIRGPSPNTQEAHVALSGSRSGPLRSSSTDFLTRNYWETETESRLIAEEPVKRAQSASHLQSDYMNLRDLQKGMMAQTRGSYADSSRSSNRSSQLSGSGAAPQVPALPPRNASSEKSRDMMLSVSGKKKCSQCGQELGRGAAMIIETLRLYYHMDCFRCCVCQSPLGSGLSGTDVRVRNAMLHCRNCYSNDDGFKFSKV